MNDIFNPHMVLLNSDYEVGTSGGGEVVLGPDPSATYTSQMDICSFWIQTDCGIVYLKIVAQLIRQMVCQLMNRVGLKMNEFS